MSLYSFAVENADLYFWSMAGVGLMISIGAIFIYAP